MEVIKLDLLGYRSVMMAYWRTRTRQLYQEIDLWTSLFRGLLYISPSLKKSSGIMVGYWWQMSWHIQNSFPQVELRQAAEADLNWSANLRWPKFNFEQMSLLCLMVKIIPLREVETEQRLKNVQLQYQILHEPSLQTNMWAYLAIRYVNMDKAEAKKVVPTYFCEVAKSEYRITYKVNLNPIENGWVLVES